MNFQNEWRELVERMKNFYCNFDMFEKQARENESFYRELYDLKKNIFDDLDRIKISDQEQILETVFTEVFNFVVGQNPDFLIFHQHYTFISPYTSFRSDELPESTLYDDVYNACLYTTLCMFINKTTRIPGITLTEFVYNNSLNYYNDETNENYCPFDHPSDDFIKEVNRLKKEREKILSSRPVYDIPPKWQGMRKDSEYEYTFMYTLEVIDPVLKDTYKRIGNLYNDINNVLSKSKNECTKSNAEDIKEQFENAFNKFLSKVEKIKYEKYLELAQEIVSHICENDKYYGINIYRFEKEFRTFITTMEVESMLACQNKSMDTRDILIMSSVLNSIYFPKLYRDFLLVPHHTVTVNYVKLLPMFLNHVESSCRLIIDELIEKGYFGEDWESFFLNTINKMTESVFYDPKKMDYTDMPVSQENFEELLIYPAKLELENAFYNYLHNKQ